MTRNASVWGDAEMVSIIAGAAFPNGSEVVTATGAPIGQTPSGGAATVKHGPGAATVIAGGARRR